ncbi:hypothetical protein FACS1894164_20420 [Spirochaetia bacterium]|nr:hypothetical protein FACS1894164_20420 [Spirochaetia bacterium]
MIGGILGFTIYSLVKKFDVREIGDMFGASIPLGYTFGRLGNFINGELYGRVTTGFWGMIFPDAQRLPAYEAWVREAAEKSGIAITSNTAMVNLPRYPSQLFEAFFEGIVLWAIIWLVRNRKPFKGFLISLYIGGYGLVRLFIEYFREPDSDLGYRIELIPNHLSPAQAHPLLSFSTGQIFSFIMIISALAWIFIAAKLPNRESIRIYPDPEVPEPKRKKKRSKKR